MMVTTPASLAEKLAPRLQEILQSRRDQIIAHASGFAQRAAIKLAFPTFIAEVPVLLRSAIELVSSEFGQMNISDLLEFLDHYR